MITASLERKTFNWYSLLTVSEVQFIIIMARVHEVMQAGMVLATSYQKAIESGLVYDTK